jgi:hypothetical protein
MRIGEYGLGLPEAGASGYDIQFRVAQSPMTNMVLQRFFDGTFLRLVLAKSLSCFAPTARMRDCAIEETCLTGTLMIIGTLSPASAPGSPSQITSTLDSAFVRLCSPFNPAETTSVVFLNSSLSSRTKTESKHFLSTLTTVARIACFT